MQRKYWICSRPTIWQFSRTHIYHAKQLMCHVAAMGNCKLHKCRNKSHWKQISLSYLKSKGCIIFASADYHCCDAFCCTRNNRLISEWHACNMAATKRRTEAYIHKPSVYLMCVYVLTVTSSGVVISRGGRRQRDKAIIARRWLATLQH